MAGHRDRRRRDVRPERVDVDGEYGGVFGYAVAVAYAVLLLLSVLAHEAGHALVARRFGFRVDRVVADLWGGHTVYDSSTSRAGTSAVISVSGPLANLALAGIGYALMQALDPDGVVGLLLFAVTLTNAFVGVFNLLPGLPLDGGYRDGPPAEARTRRTRRRCRTRRRPSRGWLRRRSRRPASGGAAVTDLGRERSLVALPPHSTLGGEP